jgi:tryptophanyl-tRNA synthetase
MSEVPKTERVLSGFRPTSDLTVGNYFGAIKPALDIQDDPTKELTVFVADMHGLTDHHPDEVAPYRRTVIHDCLALGIDPDKTTLYIQSSIEEPLTQIANRLFPYVNVAELMRIPNLKEKMQNLGRDDSSENANLGLLSYPVLMAADIFSQRAELVAVGEDQEPHVEITRKIARRFNQAFESVNPQTGLIEPHTLAIKAIRILSLNGKGKMSKSNPRQAILLTDDPDDVRNKIKKAATADVGEWNAVIKSHFTVAYGFADEEQKAELDLLKLQHLEGEAVMTEFKRLWADIMETKLVDFQAKRDALIEKDVDDALLHGQHKAYVSADRVLGVMRTKMKF